MVYRPVRAMVAVGCMAGVILLGSSGMQGRSVQPSCETDTECAEKFGEQSLDPVPDIAVETDSLDAIRRRTV